MASIFSLFGEIFIDNEKANKAIEETSSKGNDLGSKLGNAFGSIVKGAAAVGTAVAGAATTLAAGAMSMASSMASNADTIDKLSERTGINREELQRWQHAASQSGVNVDSFTNGVKKMTDVIDQANQGSSTASESLSRLGLSLDDLNAMSTEEQFSAITSALADMESGTERNAIGNDLLGKSYTEMLPLLNAGSDGIASLKQEADDLGIVMSEDAVKAGVTFGDTLANLQASIEGLGNKMGAALLPALQNVLNIALDHMPQIISIIDGMIPLITSLFEEMLPPLLDLGETLIPIILDLLSKILPPLMQIISAVLPVITDLLETLLPPILQIVDMVLPLLLDLITPLLPLLQPIFDLLQPLIDLLMALLKPLIDIISTILPPLISLISDIADKYIQNLNNVLKFCADVLEKRFGGALESVKKIIGYLKDAFGSIIEFVQNVFAGKWGDAWGNIVDIFSNVFSAIKEAFKLPINWIIDGLNAFIDGINGIKIPDWVPLVGGKSFSIPNIPRLRVGLDYVPYDDFPAILHKGEKVLTASEAQSYAEGITAGKATDNSALYAILNAIESLDNNLYKTIVSALADGTSIKWDERELARLIKKYA